MKILEKLKKNDIKSNNRYFEVISYIYLYIYIYIYIKEDILENVGRMKIDKKIIIIHIIKLFRF